MITKNDCMSILIKLEDAGVKGIDPYLKKLLVSKDVPLEVLKFISDNRGIEISNFYEMLRKSYNRKKSPLYANILRDNGNRQETALTLNCLLTQVLLYGRKLEDPDKFYKEARAEEISRVLNEYFQTGSAESCAALLRLVKSDLLVLEYIAGRRELADK